MATPTTLRVEMLHTRRVGNDKFFLTLGDGTAGMSPYNPIQLGLGVRFRVMTNNHVNDVRFTLRHLASGVERRVRPTKVGSNRWEIEGAIGGDNLGFPQPPLNYYVPQCFELDVLIRNRALTDQRTYTFWVAEGPVGSISSCIERKVIGAKSLVCCYDGEGFRGYGYPDEFTQFFLDNASPAMSCLDDDGEGLLPDPTLGVYVPGLAAPLAGGTAPAVPNIRTADPTPPNYVDPESDMERLRGSYGDQWRWRRPVAGSVDEHGRTMERFSPNAMGAPVFPAVAGTLPANPYLGVGQTPIDVAPTGPNQGVSARGPAADYWLHVLSGNTQSVAAPGTLSLYLRCRSGVPNTIHLFAGLAADWVLGLNQGAPLYRDSGAVLSQWLTSVQLAGHYGVDPAGLWTAGLPGVSIAVPPSPFAQTINIDLSLAGLAPVAGQVWAVQALIFNSPFVGAAAPGIMSTRFPMDSVISNAIRFVWIP